LYNRRAAAEELDLEDEDVVVLVVECWRSGTRGDESELLRCGKEDWTCDGEERALERGARINGEREG